MVKDHARGSVKKALESGRPENQEATLVRLREDEVVPSGQDLETLVGVRGAGRITASRQQRNNATSSSWVT